MRAIRVHRFGGPEVLQLDDIPDPLVGPGQVLVRNHAAGVNPVDAYLRAGQYARLPALPYTPGWDGAGVVEAVGEGIARVAVGDRVYFSGTTAGRGMGAYAELACCHEVNVHPLADGLGFAQGAAIGVPYATAHRALFHRAGLRAGETVLVHGASGAVGIAAVQLARAHGATVIGTAGSDRGLEIVTGEGAHAIRHGRDAAVEEIRALTAGRGVDVIVEMLANVNLDRDLGLLAMRGRVVVVGNRGRIEIDPRQTMGKDSAILGMSLWNATDEEMLEIHDAMRPGFAGGMLRPVVGPTFPLADAAQAHETVFEPGARGKVVLVF
ncbi:MAG TPA: NADPH:quinone reductase [Gemmatimonadales bacterium]|nr:NADPH:quinone reductase [Gemmatimonadales bacterium]